MKRELPVISRWGKGVDTGKLQELTDKVHKQLNT